MGTVASDALRPLLLQKHHVPLGDACTAYRSDAQPSEGWQGDSGRELEEIGEIAFTAATADREPPDPIRRPAEKRMLGIAASGGSQVEAFAVYWRRS